MTVFEFFELMRLLKVRISLFHTFLFFVMPAFSVSHEVKFRVHGDFFIFYDVIIDYFINKNLETYFFWNEKFKF